MLFLVALSIASATTVHVCDCGDGSDPDCTIGNDGAAGTSPEEAWQSVEVARLWWAKAKPGDEVRFCSGGTFALPEQNRWVAQGCTAETPCVIGAYAADWATGDEGRPLMVQEEDLPGFRFDEPGDALHQEGIQLVGLELVCTGCADDGGRGVLLANDIDDVAIEDLVVSGFDVGVQVGTSATCAKADPACDGKNERITITGSALHDNLSYGFLGSGNGLALEGNTFRNNGSGVGADHNLYVDATQSPDAGVRIVGNDLRGAGAGSSDTCGEVEIQVEGAHASLVIAGNRIEEMGVVDDACGGISVSPGISDRSEGFNAALIKNNVVKNVGTVGIGVGGCDSCTVENNILEWDAGGQPVIAIMAPDRPRGSDDVELTALTVRNNTIVIGTSGTGIQVDVEGIDHVIVSNVILYEGAEKDWNCLDANLPTSSYVEIDHNLCWFPNVLEGEWNDSWGTNPDPLEAWSQASGFGDNCLWTDPALDPKTWAPVDESSPVVGGGHPTRSSPDDILGTKRFDADIGAYEWTVPVDTGDTGPTDTGDTAVADDSGGGTGDGSADDSGGGGSKDDGCGCGRGPLRAPVLAVLGVALVTLRRRR